MLLAVVLAVIPFEVVQRLGGFGVTTGATAAELFAAGIVLAALAGARSFAKPTRAYGPVSLVTAAAGIGYLLWLAGRATVAIAPTADVGIALGYGTILELLAIAPALGLVAALVTTIEDARHPGERLPFDYPAR